MSTCCGGCCNNDQPSKIRKVEVDNEVPITDRNIKIYIKQRCYYFLLINTSHLLRSTLREAKNFNDFSVLNPEVQ